MQMTRFVNNLNEAIASGDFEHIETCLTRLQGKYPKLEEKDENVMKTIADEQACQAEQLFANRWYKEADQAIAAATRAMRQLSTPNPSVAPPTAPAATTPAATEFK